jgi:tripartite ATP-independent transporter DctM subunit
VIGGEAFLDFGAGTIAALAVVVGILALLGEPLFAVIGSAAILFYLSGDDPLDLIGIFTEVARIVETPLFVSIPLFVLAGTVLAESRAPQRLVDLDRALFGWMPGGLAITATVACAFFTAFTGASGVTIIALGGLLYPVLVAEKYPERFSLGLLTTGGSLGLLFPPSLPVIVYGIVGKVDTDRLFLAGVVPGLLLVGAISLYSVGVGVRRRVPRHAFSVRTAARAFLRAAPELPIPVIIVGGIYSGLITAIEAAAATAFYVLLVEVAIYRDVRARDLPGIMRKTAELVGALVVILGMAMGLANYLVDHEVPQEILAAMKSRITSPISFLLVLNAFLLIVGCLLDVFSATLVVVPLIAPLAARYDIDPFHLGVIFLTNLEIGYLTPPVGINLFLASLRFGKPVFEIARASMPYLLLLLGCLALITYVPWLSTWHL